MLLTRRRHLTALTLLLSSTALGACGTSSGAGSTASPQASGTSTAPGTAAPAPAVTGPVTGGVTVLAAASLQDAFTELAATFEKENPGATVSFDFQGSQDLVTALAEGSSADVLATANLSTMKDAADQGLVGEQTEIATNILTLIVPADNPAGVTGLDSSLKDADLVICAPQVPCGEATQKLATELGVTLSPSSEEQKVTDVRGKVESGEADAGIVYTTDAADAGKAVKTITLPTNDVVNHYPIAMTTNATNSQGARAFINLVLSEAGQKVLQGTYGFGAPATK